MDLTGATADKTKARYDHGRTDLMGADKVLYERAAPIAGRSLTRSKAPGRFYPFGAGPHYALSGEDATVRCSNGFLMVDMLCGLGAISLGHGAHDTRSGLMSLPYDAEGDAAQAVLERVAPWATSVRFVKTGSEATHAAYRIAKRATGRKYVMVGDWAYHGWHEWCERQADGKTPESPFTVLYPHGKADGDHAALSASLDALLPIGVTLLDVAAIFVEPHRWETVSVEWLRELRAVCDRFGILLVFDEMIYGGRWAMGGGTEFYEVRPDMACYGKAFGNGTAVAFTVGTAAMEEHGQIASGTYSGDLTGLSAVISVLRAYRDEDVLNTLWRRGRQLARGLDELVRMGLAVAREGQPVHQRLRFADDETAQRFSAGMAHRGVLWHPACVNVSAAHTADLIERVIDAAYASAMELRA